jgi:hypothetical protein
MVSATATSAQPFGPARVPCPGHCAAWLISASCSFFGFLLAFKQHLLPAMASLCLFRFGHTYTRVVLGKTSGNVVVDPIIICRKDPMTCPRAGALGMQLQLGERDKGRRDHPQRPLQALFYAA